MVRVTNMTSLFSKEMLIYSFFDLRLKTPLRVAAIFYFVLLFSIIGAPIFYFFGPPNVYTVMIGVGIPFGGAVLMSKPIWNGKSFWSFFKTQVKYYFRPRERYDWKTYSVETKYEVEGIITISRHDDYYSLYNQVKEEELK